MFVIGVAAERDADQSNVTLVCHVWREWSVMTLQRDESDDLCLTDARKNLTPSPVCLKRDARSAVMRDERDDSIDWSVTKIRFVIFRRKKKSLETNFPPDFGKKFFL